MADIHDLPPNGRPIWQANQEAKTCFGCDRLFNMYLRRHHCRGCGKLVCDKCSSSRLELPEAYGYGPGKQRVCDSCWKTALNIKYEADLSIGAIQAPDFPKLRDELLKKAGHYLSLPESRWITKEDKNVKISTQAIENHPIFAVRTEVVIHAAMAQTREVYGNMKLWKHWNPYVTAQQVEIVDDRSKVYEATYDAPIIRKRSTIFFFHTIDGSLIDPNAQNAMTTLAMSVDHPLCPPKKGVIRAAIIFSMTSLEAINEGKHTRMTSLVHSDPKGLLPPFVVNAFLSRGADHLRGMCDYIESRNGILLSKA